MNRAYDAVVVGSGPNGLAAAVALAREGHSVVVLEAADTPGGGARSAALTLPGFIHDVCSAVHPMAVASPFFRTLPLAERGLEWVQPPAPAAHPLDDGTAAVQERSLDATALGLGQDARAYRGLMGPLVRNAEGLFGDLLGPLRLPHHPLAGAAFGFRALRSVQGLAARWYNGAHARALLAGHGGHSMLPFDQPASAAAALMLATAGHVVGWPLPRGGAQRITDALVSYLRSLGSELITGRRVGSLDELPPARAVLLNMTPRQIVRVAGDRLPERYKRRLERFRYGPGVFKVDWALAGPIPWRAGECARAATVHLGGTMAEIAAAEQCVWNGEHPERPFVLLTQPSLFDPTRAPPGRHTAWGYCHVPNGSSVDMTERIEAQVERFAPGFRDRILARHTRGPAELERDNANCVGGDIAAGVMDLRQLFSRPVGWLNPYSMPMPGVYICSASTPPGGGVHGMCGYFAARAAVRYLSRGGRLGSTA
jgi:phytoene dehydrogenase-like protein